MIEPSLESSRAKPRTQSSCSPQTAVVIGAGFGGLALAIRLQCAGFQVQLLEARDKAGGRAYVYKDQGFHFDAGPTVITAPESLSELFELAQEQMSDHVELMPVDPFYRLWWEDGLIFDYTQDSKRIHEQIRAVSEQDVAGYERFYEYSKKVYQRGYKDLVHVPFLKMTDMFKVAPDLIRLNAHRSVYSQVAKFIQDPHLRQAFSFHSLLVGGNPFNTSAIYTLIHYLERNGGVWFPKGGTGALVQALVDLFERLGGKCRLNAQVDEILAQAGRVQGVKLKGGEMIQSPIVASNADVVHTYSKLLKDVKTVSPSRSKALGMQQGMSLFLIYFGTKKTYPNLRHHTVMFGPRYRELLESIFKGGPLAQDFSLYLHAPTRTDSSLAPPDCEAFYVLSPVPHLGHQHVINWNQEAHHYKNKIYDYLEKHLLPDLRANLVTERIFTPLDFQDQLLSHQGSAFSFAPTLLQSAYFRAHNRDPHLKGLYFVGAGTHPGAGVPGVVNSGKATAKLVIQDFATYQPERGLA